jgi:hypothetical protein
MVMGRGREVVADVIMSTFATAGLIYEGGKMKVEQKMGAEGADEEGRKRALQKAIIQGPTKTIGFLGRISKGLLGTFGIQFSIASIMKQSQIFTGTLGTIFQILGALVDVMLAPFMPLFVRIIRRMVTWIPIVQEKAEQAAAWLERSWLSNEGDTMNFLVGVIVKAVSVIPWGKILGAILFNRAGLAIGALGVGAALAPFTGGTSLLYGAGIASAVAGTALAENMTGAGVSPQDVTMENRQNEQGFFSGIGNFLQDIPSRIP